MNEFSPALKELMRRLDVVEAPPGLTSTTENLVACLNRIVDRIENIERVEGDIPLPWEK